MSREDKQSIHGVVPEDPLLALSQARHQIDQEFPDFKVAEIRGADGSLLHFREGFDLISANRRRACHQITEMTNMPMLGASPVALGAVYAHWCHHHGDHPVPHQAWSVMTNVVCEQSPFERSVRLHNDVAHREWLNLEGVLGGLLRRLARRTDLLFPVGHPYPEQSKRRSFFNESGEHGIVNPARDRATARSFLIQRSFAWHVIPDIAWVESLLDQIDFGSENFGIIDALWSWLSDTASRSSPWSKS